MSATKTRGALILIEVLLLISILGVAMCLLLPAIQHARDAAARAQSQNNLKQMGLAIHKHYDAHKWTPAADGYIGIATDPGFDKFTGTAFTHMLPFVEQEPLYKAIRAGAVTQGSPPRSDGVTVDSLKVTAYIATVDPSFVGGQGSPADGTTSYGSNARVLGGQGCKFAAIDKGLSRTLAFAERYARPSLSGGAGPATHAPHYWVNQLLGPDTTILASGAACGPTFYFPVGLPQFKPSIATADEQHANGHTRGVVQVGMFDGGVHGVSEGVTLDIWQEVHNSRLPPGDPHW